VHRKSMKIGATEYRPGEAARLSETIKDDQYPRCLLKNARQQIARAVAKLTLDGAFQYYEMLLSMSILNEDRKGV